MSCPYIFPYDQSPLPCLPQVDAASEPSGYIPLHLACLTGHVGVVGLLLSRSTELLKVTPQNYQMLFVPFFQSGKQNTIIGSCPF